MHRFIFGLRQKDKREVDHKDGNTLNCRRANLRICNRSQNNSNAPKNRKNKSGFKGVHWHKGSGKWSARTKLNGKKIHIGYFNSKEEAARAYDEAAKKYHGEFARLKFP